MPWAIQVPLLPDETISSWLARAALMQGCDPLVLTGAIWPGWRVWTLDSDRGIPVDRIRALSDLSGTPSAIIESAALRNEAERIAGQSLPDTRSWPWILTLGAKNRARLGGQQFCPVCMAQDKKPYYRRQWRFAWNTACPMHETQFLDRCHNCAAPVEPHRLLAEDRHLAQCARCKSSLREAINIKIRPESLAFQQMANETMNKGSGTFGDQVIPVSDWFATARFLTGLLRQACRNETSKLTDAIKSLGINVGREWLPETGLPLELLPVCERQTLLEATHRLIQLGPNELSEYFGKSGVTAASIHDVRKQNPLPVREILSLLPSSKRAPRISLASTRTRHRSKKAVMAAWARLQRKMQADTK